MSDHEAEQDGPPRAKRNRRMTDKGKSYQQSLLAEQSEEQPGPSTSRDAMSGQRELVSGDILDQVGDSDIGDDTDRGDNSGDKADETPPPDVTIPNMALMARWFAEMTQIMGEMRQMKQEFHEMRAASGQQPRQQSQQQPQTPRVSDRADMVPQVTQPSTSGQQQQQQQQSGNQSSGKKGFVSRYAINRNLVPGKVNCNLPRLAGEQPIVSDIELLPQVTDFDVNRAKGSVVRDNNNDCNLAKGHSAASQGGSDQTGVNNSDTGALMWTPPPVQNDMNVSGIRQTPETAQNQATGMQQIPLIPQTSHIMHTGAQNGALSGASNVPTSIFPPPERHASLGPVMTSTDGHQQQPLPPVESLASTIAQIQMQGVPDSPEEMVPVAADGLQVVMKSQVELQKMLTECMLVGAGVEERMIKKIWSGQFVDFPELLHNDQPGVYDVTYTQDEGSKQMSLTQRPKKEITCYEDWLQAWETYHVVYLKHPANAVKHQQMVTYAKHIRTFREQGYNWIQYDRTFRHQRLTFGTAIPPWGCIRQDLWNNMVTERQLNGPFREPGAPQAGQSSTKGQFRKQGKGNKTGFIPKSYCYGYHLPQRTCDAGDDCTFNHDCPKCSGEHPAHTCSHKPKKKGGKGNGAKGSGAGKKPAANAN